MFYLQLFFVLFIIIFYISHFQLPKLSLFSKKKIDIQEKPQNTKPENTKPKITFFSKLETKDFLTEDKDNFFGSLDAPNLFSRGVKYANEYKTITSKATTDFTKKEEQLLTRCIQNVCDKMYDLPEKVCKKYGMKQELLWKLLKTWNLAKTKDKVLELGMPHTRGNVIFLSTYYLVITDDNEEKITQTLSHEFYHIYQRTYKKEYDQFLKDNDWEIVPYNKTDKRMNPDLDDNVWKRTKNNRSKIFIAKYNSLEPNSLTDINIKNPRDEHPNEYYAYLLAKEIN